MSRVVRVNLPYNVKSLWFDVGDQEISADDKVVVETKRGVELGVASTSVQDIPYESIQSNQGSVGRLLRKATSEDIQRASELADKGQEALRYFRELAHEVSEEMHPVSVEYLLEGDKAVFYFEAEERIDFRDMVRKLASHFHVKVDMHQIGVRDEARIIGGLAHCGQVVCCKRLGGEFEPVSIRMAKAQDLSLNPQKISGLCGRLMCCLRYEFDTYKDFNSKVPKVGKKVMTPDGPAKVVEHDVPRETISVKLEDGDKAIKVSLEDIEQADDSSGQKRITDEGWQRALEEVDRPTVAIDLFTTSQFTGTDALDTHEGAIHHERKKVAKDPSSRGGKKQDNRTRRRRSTTIKGGVASKEESEGNADGQSDGNANAGSKQGTKPRRGRNRQSQQNGRSQQQKRGQKGSQGQGRQVDRQGSDERKLRPGHKSSALSKGQGHGKGQDKAHASHGNRKSQRGQSGPNPSTGSNNGSKGQSGSGRRKRKSRSISSEPKPEA